MKPKLNAAFWKWFGKSKVVDAKGNPLVVYHGTYSDFVRFKPGKVDKGIFFSTSKTASRYTQHASGEGGNVMPIYLSLQNPLIVDDPLSGISLYAANYYDLAQKELRQQAESEGRDGIIVRSRRKDRVVYVALDPAQIKSATGNDGTWDADDADIRSNPGNLEAQAERILRRLSE